MKPESDILDADLAAEIDGQRAFDDQEKELMDESCGSTSALAATLRRLEVLNRYFGGHRYLRGFLATRFQRGDTCRILDLATGGGDFPRAIIEWARESGVRCTVDAIDRNPAIVDLARGFSVAYPEVRYLTADVRTFSTPREYDLVHLSLSLHHFSTKDAVWILQRMATLSSRWVLVTDLERRWLTRWSVRFINAVLGENDMSDKDGETSARRAFSYREFGALARAAGWADFEHRRIPLCQQAVWMSK